MARFTAAAISLPIARDRSIDLSKKEKNQRNSREMERKRGEEEEQGRRTGERQRNPRDRENPRAFGREKS